MSKTTITYIIVIDCYYIQWWWYDLFQIHWFIEYLFKDPFWVCHIFTVKYTNRNHQRLWWHQWVSQQMSLARPAVGSADSGGGSFGWCLCLDAFHAYHPYFPDLTDWRRRMCVCVSIYIYSICTWLCSNKWHIYHIYNIHKSLQINQRMLDENYE